MVLINTIAMQIERKQKGAVMERLTQTSNSGGVAFTFDSDITCQPSEARKILNLRSQLLQKWRAYRIMKLTALATASITAIQEIMSLVADVIAERRIEK